MIVVDFENHRTSIQSFICSCVSRLISRSLLIDSCPPLSGARLGMPFFRAISG